MCRRNAHSGSSTSSVRTSTTGRSCHQQPRAICRLWPTTRMPSHDAASSIFAHVTQCHSGQSKRDFVLWRQHSRLWLRRDMLYRRAVLLQHRLRHVDDVLLQAGDPSLFSPRANIQAAALHFSASSPEDAALTRRSCADLIWSFLAGSRASTTLTFLFVFHLLQIYINSPFYIRHTDYRQTCASSL